MNRTAFLAGLLLGMLVAWASACGGGGSSTAPPEASVVMQAPPTVGTLAFDEQWEPRTTITKSCPPPVVSSTGVIPNADSSSGWMLPGLAAATPCVPIVVPDPNGNGVFGIVTPAPLTQTADGSDPQQPWAANTITGRWGTLRGSDGSISGISVNVIGDGPNPWWGLSGNGQMSFHAEPQTSPAGNVGGWALISKQTFQRSGRIVAETTIDLTQGAVTAFAGLALITGEGDYRELAIYRRATGDTIDLVAPLHASTLIPRPAGPVTLRIEYDPASGFRYYANGVLIGTEALDHLGASFVADPQVALYFTGNSNTPNAYAEGYVGPVRVWVN